MSQPMIEVTSTEDPRQVVERFVRAYFTAPEGSEVAVRYGYTENGAPSVLLELLGRYYPVDLWVLRVLIESLVKTPYRVPANAVTARMLADHLKNIADEVEAEAGRRQ